MKRWRAENKHRYREYHKTRYLKHRTALIKKAHWDKWYRRCGLGFDYFREMLRVQGGLCAICTIAMKPGKETHIDHDHVTGDVRGLLCNKCNWAVGHAENRNWDMATVAEYLSK